MTGTPTRYEGTTIGPVPKEKVTLSLDTSQLTELRTLVGARSLSATVDRAVTAELARLRHRTAVDRWLDEMEQEHGPVPAEPLAWAVQVVDQWRAQRDPS